MSIANSFLSITDHLPADLVRSLWLVQSLNININKVQKQVAQLSDQDPDYKSNYLLLSSKLQTLIDESISESRLLHNQLLIYQESLNGQIHKFNQYKFKNDKKSEYKELRKKIKTHYLENPLTSQQEALKQNKKLVLKLPKLVKPTIKQKTNERHLIKKSHKVAKLTQTVAPIPDSLESLSLLEYSPIHEESNKYCFCGQGSFGDMIACDNEGQCPNGEWFHYKCVGLLNKVEALKYTTGKIKWFCSDECKEKYNSKKRKKRRRW